MTTTTTRSSFADLAAFQAGLIDKFPRIAWDERVAADFARREAEQDARWKGMREWLTRWRDAGRDTLREVPGDSKSVRFNLAFIMTALDEMTRLEAVGAADSKYTGADLAAIRNGPDREAV